MTENEVIKIWLLMLQMRTMVHPEQMETQKKKILDPEAQNDQEAEAVQALADLLPL